MASFELALILLGGHPFPPNGDFSHYNGSDEDAQPETRKLS
jgi:hypothetical protein